MDRYKDRLKNVLCLMSLSVIKQLKCHKPLFTLLQVATMKYLLESSGVSMKISCVDRGRFVVAPDERVRSVNYDKDGFARKNVNAFVVKVRDVKNICH